MDPLLISQPMTFHFSEARQLLERTPQSLFALLQGLSPAWLDAQESESSWNARQVLMHLLYAETVHWPSRVQVAMSDGAPKLFASFDQTAQFSVFADHTMDQLLREFCDQRSTNLRMLDALNLQESDFERCATHPSLGVVQLRNILASWTAHDLAHLVQVARVFARQYQQEVGPWAQNMSLLRTS